MGFGFDVLPAWMKRGNAHKEMVKSQMPSIAQPVKRHVFLLKHPDGILKLQNHLIQNFLVHEVYSDDGHGVFRVLSINLAEFSIKSMRTDGSIVQKHRISQISIGSQGDWAYNDGRRLVIRFPDKVMNCLPIPFLKKGERMMTSGTYVFMHNDDASHFVSLIHGVQFRPLVNPSYSPLSYKDLNVFVTTFNCGKADFGPLALPAWIDNVDKYDICAIGMQESTGANFKEITKYMGVKFVCIAQRKMNEISIIVYAKVTLSKSIAKVMSFNTATGIGGAGTNKGGVLVAFHIGELKLAFINCHLAARASKKRLLQRNANVRKIIECSSIGLNHRDILSEYNMFFFGDMNYRIELPREEVTNFAADYQYEILKNKDQLIMEMQESRVFLGFKEGAIDFPPTYKYHHYKNTDWEPVMDKGKLVGMCLNDPTVEPTPFSIKKATELGIADRTTSKGLYFAPWQPGKVCREYTPKKNQTPSWCDRVLYKSLPHTMIEQTEYRSCDMIQSSDHSPVVAGFKISQPQLSYKSPFFECVIKLHNIQVSSMVVANKRRMKKEDRSNSGDSELIHIVDIVDDIDDYDETDDEDDNNEVSDVMKNKNLVSSVLEKQFNEHGTINPNARESIVVNDRTLKPSLIPRDNGISNEPSFTKTSNFTIELLVPMLRGISDHSHIFTSGKAQYDGKNGTIKWKNDDLPEVGPLLTQLDYMSNNSITLNVLHGKKFIGACNVSINRCFNNLNRFEEPILKNGVKSGVISGEIKLCMAYQSLKATIPSVSTRALEKQPSKVNFFLDQHSDKYIKTSYRDIMTSSITTSNRGSPRNLDENANQSSSKTRDAYLTSFKQAMGSITISDLKPKKKSYLRPDSNKFVLGLKEALLTRDTIKSNKLKQEGMFITDNPMLKIE